MQRVRRTDVARLDQATKTPEGFLVAPGYVARTGVLEYLRADGTVQREIRLDEDVFSPASLASFDLKPLTVGHPREGVDAKSARYTSVGVVSGPRKADDGRHVVATVAVHDSDAVETIEKGTRQLSAGYRCDLEPIEGGVYKMPDGSEIRADYIQRNIAGNHVAIVESGRAGPSASIRLDSAGDVITTEDEEKQDMDPKQLQAENEKLKQRLDEFEKLQAKKDDEAKAANEAKAKQDAAELEKLRGENAALKAKQDAAEKAHQAQVHADICARVAKVTGEKLDEVSARTTIDAMKAAVTKLAPGVKLDGVSNEFVAAAFETAMATVKGDTTDSAAAAVAAGARAALPADAVVQARKKNDAFLANAWKNPSA